MHAFEERNLLFLPFPFPFQSTVHSWNQGTLHADEQDFTFFQNAHSDKRWAGAWGEEKVERGAPGVEESKIT